VTEKVSLNGTKGRVAEAPHLQEEKAHSDRFGSRKKGRAVMQTGSTLVKREEKTFDGVGDEKRKTQF